VTIQLPSTVEIFNTYISLSEPFVNGIHVNYLVPTLSVIDIGVVLLLFSLLIEEGASFYLKMLKSLKTGLLIFLIYLIIQNVFLKNFLITFNSLRIFFYLLAIISTVLYYKERKKQLKSFLLSATFVLLLNVSIQGVIGILQVSRGASLGLTFLGESQVVSGMYGSSFINLGGQAFLRAYGTFPHPNIFAGFLILSLLIGTLCARRLPGFGVSLVLLSLLVLPLTFSRAAILIVALILLILFIRALLRSNKKVGVLAVSPLLYFERFGNLVRGGDSSWSERTDLLKVSIKLVKENFWLGTGMGNFVKAMEDYVPRTFGRIPLLQPVHNIFVLVLVELGLPGFLILFYILGKVFLNNFKKFSYFKIAVLFTILIIGFWDHYLLSLPQGLGIFMFLYLLLVLDLDLDSMQQGF
jgi:O-antigen ligase